MTNAELLKEIDRLDRQIKEEQQRALQLRTELRNGSRSNTLVHEVYLFLLNNLSIVFILA